MFTFLDADKNPDRLSIKLLVSHCTDAKTKSQEHKLPKCLCGNRPSEPVLFSYDLFDDSSEFWNCPIEWDSVWDDKEFKNKSLQQNKEREIFLCIGC